MKSTSRQKLEGENFAFYVLLLQLQTLQRLAISILASFQIVIVFEIPTKSCLEFVNAFHLFAIPPQYLLEECPNVHFRLILCPNLWVIVNDTALTNHCQLSFQFCPVILHYKMLAEKKSQPIYGAGAISFKPFNPSLFLLEESVQSVNHVRIYTTS